MKIEKHGKLACHVWVLLVAKTATSGSTLQRNYPVAWRQPAIGRAPWRSDEESEERSGSECRSKSKASEKDEAKFEEALVEEIRSYPCIWNTYSRSYKEQQKKQFAWSLIENKLRKEGKLYTQECIWFGWMFTGVDRRTLLHLIWGSLERYFATVSKMAAVFCMTINFMKPIVYSHKTVAELLNRPLVQNWLYVIQPTEKLSPRACSNWFNPFMLGGNKSSYYSKPAALSCWFV